MSGIRAIGIRCFCIKVSFFKFYFIEARFAGLVFFKMMDGIICQINISVQADFGSHSLIIR